MKSGKSRIIITVLQGVGAAGGLLALIGWSSGCFRAKVAPGEIEAAAGFAVPAGAETVAAVREEVAPRIDVVGTAVSEERIHLSARLGAYVRQVLVSAGDTVRKDQTLLTLDDRELREQRAVAEAQFQQARAEFERTRKLREAEAATDQALTAAQAAFDAASAQVKQIEVMLTYAEIHSPIDGRVADRRVEVGDLAGPGQVLLSVYDPERMRLDAAVPSRLVHRLTLGQTLEVTLEEPARLFTGTVSGVVAEIDPQSRTQTVKIRLAGARGEVLPGTFGRAWVREDPRPAILAPAAAVYRVGQLELVQVANGGRAERRMVRTGSRFGERVEVLAGLDGGELLLVKPVRE